MFAVTWGDWDSKGGRPYHPGDECGGGHSSFLPPAEMRITSFPQMDVVSQPPATVGCYTHSITPTCTVYEEIEFLYLLLKRKSKVTWPIKWKLEHWTMSLWWPSVSGRLADSFSWWKHMMHWITGGDKMETSTHLSPVKLLFSMMWQLCHLLQWLMGDNKHALLGG